MLALRRYDFTFYVVNRGFLFLSVPATLELDAVSVFNFNGRGGAEDVSGFDAVSLEAVRGETVDMYFGRGETNASTGLLAPAPGVNAEHKQGTGCCHPAGCTR